MGGVSEPRHSCRNIIDLRGGGSRSMTGRGNTPAVSLQQTNGRVKARVGSQDQQLTVAAFFGVKGASVATLNCWADGHEFEPELGGVFRFAGDSLSV